MAQLGQTNPFTLISTSGSIFGAAFNDRAKIKGKKYLITNFPTFWDCPWFLERYDEQYQLLSTVDGFLFH